MAPWNGPNKYKTDRKLERLVLSQSGLGPHTHKYAYVGNNLYTSYVATFGKLLSHIVPLHVSPSSITGY